MTNKRAFISPELAHELVKNIRLLALSGKRNFRQYLYDPLVYAGWERDKAHLAASTGKLMDKIQEDSADPAYQHAIALHCKRLISQGLAEGLSALGDSCIFFLEKMQEEPNLAASNEATDFVLAVEKPLKDFAKITSDNNEKKFEESILNLSAEDVKAAFEPIRLDGTRKKVYLETELHTLYQQVLVATKSNNLVKCKKLLSRYIITYNESENYNKSEVETLLIALDKRENGFRQNLWDSLAIEIYYSVTRGIMEGNAKKAILGIRKYAYIFEGDPNAKFYYEIDGLERKLYGIIQAKDLMKDLKRGN
ncbi:hypothetical protein [Leptospira sp. 'Mane']|uniref:hypothetical protein n=1 Tax=Leptospira sp. 'Mane' TaxID=3387407 RepID=UPI00398A6A74